MTDGERLLKEKYRGEKGAAFFADMKRLEAGEPLAYVIGHIPFLDTIIHLDSRPLIPRPETEFWVERAIAFLRSAAPLAPRVLDLCAGSGCIGIAVAKAIPEAHVTFAELSRAHLPTIAKNLATNGIDCTRYQVFASDLFADIRGTFDFILSNPPYIDPVLDRTEPSVKHFEPAEALYGGTGGLELTERILASLKQSLKPGGQLWLEHEPEQVAALKTFAETYNLTVATHNDQYNVPRYSIFTVAQ